MKPKRVIQWRCSPSWEEAHAVESCLTLKAICGTVPGTGWFLADDSYAQCKKCMRKLKEEASDEK